MIRYAFALAALLALSPAAFAADTMPAQPNSAAPVLRQTAELPRDARPEKQEPAVLPQGRDAEKDAWRAQRQAALHYCFDPCIEPKTNY